MRTKSIFLLIYLFFLACSPSRVVHFTSDTFLSSGEKNRFKMIIPKEAKSIPKRYLQEDILKQFEWQHHGVIYISLDISYANSPNKNNWLKCSTQKEKCKEGKQEDGKYWREVLKDGLVVGYYDVVDSGKALFDQSIKSFTKI